MRTPQPTVTVFFCDACGWDDMCWGPDFWQRHKDPGEDRTPRLPCRDGGTDANVRKLTYEFVEETT